MPLRSQTISKLELMAAVLGARLAATAQESLELEFTKQYFWSDSRTVIHWLNSEKKLTSFVTARKEEILELTNLHDWHWVPTKENVADDCTRDVPLQDFNANHRWFSGPTFLLKEESDWPKLPEVTVMVVQEAAENSSEPKIKLPEIKTYYTLIRLLQTTAWIKRLAYNIHNRDSKKLGPLESGELAWAEKLWWKKVQAECFSHDIQAVKEGKKNKKGKLTKLQLVLDEDDLLRVSGRFETIEEFDIILKQPVCLDGSHPYVVKLINDLHIRLGHQGIETVVNELRKRFWIPKIRTVIRRVISNCFFCKKRNSRPGQPMMGQLPMDRFRVCEKPFAATGVDYFGPFTVKIGRRTEERYGVMFTCLTTRAVHIEIAHSLTTDSCIMAIRRFKARRGEVKVLRSDNGTNFRGASRELMAALEDLNESHIQTKMTNSHIDWQFIPPASPHMGGCWERMIGCFKRTIQATLQDKNPSEEVLQTVFAEAEYIVNSRPLTYISSESGELESISPNDILLQKSVRVTPPGVFSEDDELMRKQWRVSQYLADQFWHRFINEYIPTLHQRKKWTTDQKDIEIGEIVQIGDNNMCRTDWPVGVVTKVFHGPDERVRVADVKTSSGTYRRPAVKLYRLNIRTHNGESVPGGEMCLTE